MRRTRWILFLLLFLLLGWPSARAGQVAVLFDSKEVDSSVRQVLDDLQLQLGAPVWEAARPETECSRRPGLRLVDLPDSLDTVKTYELINALKGKNGVLAVGEALRQDNGSVTFYSGQVIVRFDDPEQSAQAWADANDSWSLIGQPSGDRYLFRAELAPARLLALAGAPSSPFLEVDPILRTLGRRTPRGVFHRIPPERNLLAVVYKLGEDRSPSDRIIDANEGERISDPDDDDVEIFRFPDECAMMQAQAELIEEGAAPEVVRTGPVVSRNPLAFLSGQIVIRFANSRRLSPDAISLLESHGLVQVRNVNYLDGGRLYRAPVPSYALYDLARQLIPEHADIAVPNLISRNRSEDCNSVCSLSWSNQEYLEQMNVCGSSLEVAAHDPVIGVLDEGFAGDLAYSRVEVAAGIKLETMQDCVLGSDDWQITDPPIPWKDASCNSVWHAASHGLGVALTAAAKNVDADSDGDLDDDLRGVAPGVKLLNAARKSATHVDGDLMSDVALADALWWLGGGDPGWCRDDDNYACTGTPCVTGTSSACDEPPLPGPLGEGTRADVINLSFDREDFLEVSCADHGACHIVCGEGVDPCGVVESALQALRNPAEDLGIRDGGVLVVAAAGIHSTSPDDPFAFENQRCDDCDLTSTWTFHTDLPASTATVAAGSVTTSGEIFIYRDKTCENGMTYPAPGAPCTISHPGRFLDVVAPMGGGSDTKLCEGACDESFGKSSAAAAAVSGVAALMFSANPGLTAPQAHCILRETAQMFTDPGEMWETGTLDGWTYLRRGTVAECGADATDCDLATDCSPGPDCQWEDRCNLGLLGVKSSCVGHGMVDACRAVQAARDCRWCYAHYYDPSTGMLARSEVRTPCLQLAGETPEDCICDRTGTPDDSPVLLGDFELCLNCESHLPVEKADAIADEIVKLLACVTEQRCMCERPDCLEIDVVNHSGKELEKVNVKACIETECLEDLGYWDSWPVGKKIEVPLPTSSTVLSAWREQGKTVHLRAFDSHGNRVHFQRKPASSSPDAGSGDPPE